MDTENIIERLNTVRYSLYGSIVMELGHEINNHLNSISLSSQIIDLYLNNDHHGEIDQKLLVINNNIGAIQRFTQKMVSIKELIKAEDISKNGWELVNPQYIIRDTLSSVGCINRFDRVSIEYSSIPSDFYLHTNLDVFDLLIFIILLDISLLIKQGAISIRAFSGNMEKGLCLELKDILSFPSMNDLFFKGDTRIIHNGLLISLNLVNDALKLFNADLKLDFTEEKLHAVRIIYS